MKKDISKEDEKKREELRLKMMEHRDAADELYNQIDIIDNKSRKDYIDSVIGKCFKSDCTYIRVEKYHTKHGRFYGTTVDDFRKDDPGPYRVSINDSIFESDMGEEISSEEFSEMLKEFTSLMKGK